MCRFLDKTLLELGTAGVMDESRLKETTATTLVGNGYATQESDPCGTKMFGNVRDKARKKRERK